MTIKQVQALSDDELRIKVAELCGWELRETSEYHRFIEGGDRHYWHGPNYEQQALPTDYPHDLNACHEMEKMLWDVGHVCAYESNLDLLCAAQPTWCATARQRCEAFVITMEDVK